jgi:hypothetical protein
VRISQVKGPAASAGLLFGAPLSAGVRRFALEGVRAEIARQLRRDTHHILSATPV